MTRLNRLPPHVAKLVESSTDTRPSTVVCPAPSTRHNVKTERAGYLFDSRAEADHWMILMLRQQAGEIMGLRRQPKYVLQEGLRRRHSPGRRAITYKADFEYYENGQRIACEVKGWISEAFSIRRRLFEAKFPEIRLEIVKVERKRRR